jgi:hypothetical protein
MDESFRNMLLAAAADSSVLTVDLIAEILSRVLSQVPYSSLCRFKCVSKSWLALCSDPGLRRKSRQTLSGFQPEPDHQIWPFHQYVGERTAYGRPLSFLLAQQL